MKNLNALQLSNDVTLMELDMMVKTPDDAEDLEFAFIGLPVRTKLDLIRGYNKLENPDFKQSAIIVASLSSMYRERIFNEKDSKEVASALNKCAEIYASNGASDRQKRHLGRELKYLVIGQPETAASVLNILDKHLTDVDVIEPIRSCISRDYSLLDKGFTAIHKSVDNVCAKAEKAGKKEPEFAASEQIRVAFADLYCGPKGSLDSAEMIDKISSYFPSFENQIRRKDAGSLHSQCEWMMHHAENDAAKSKAGILRDTFLEFSKSDKSFAEIYANITAEHQEKLHLEAFKAKVRENVMNKTGLKLKELALLNKISTPHEYTTLKQAGDTEFNKMLMKARNDAYKK